MSSITISQLPVTGTIQDTGNIAIETAGVTQRIQASSLKSYISSGSLTSISATTATLGSATVTGLLNAGSIVTSSDVLIGGNLVVIGTENVSGNVTLANLIAQIESAGNVTLANLLATGNTVIGNTSIGNAFIGQLAAVITTTNQPYISTLGNIQLNNLTANTNISAGNLSVQGITTINGAMVPVSNVAAVNIGSTTSWFNNIYGTAVHALYADLAERYTSDSKYPPGTVVVFGTDTEVTASYKPNDPRVAGVVSTNPAYTMNAGVDGVDVALQGRVPCQVMGTITRGDMLVTGPVPGVAIASDNPAMGTVIGKALENYNSNTVGLIEVVVGRL